MILIDYERDVAARWGISRINEVSFDDVELFDPQTFSIGMASSLLLLCTSLEHLKRQVSPADFEFIVLNILKVIEPVRKGKPGKTMPTLKRLSEFMSFGTPTFNFLDPNDARTLRD